MAQTSETLHFLRQKYPDAVAEAEDMVRARIPQADFRREAAGLPPRPESAAPEAQGRVMLEAVILSRIRPALLVYRGTCQRPAKPVVPQVTATLDRIETTPAMAAHVRRAIGLSGQIVFLNHERLGALGTGWVVRRLSEDRAVVLTNRHVAEEFARRDAFGGYGFRLNRQEGVPYALNLGFLNEYRNPDAWNAGITRILHIEGDSGPDIALVQVEGEGVARALAVTAGALQVSEALSFAAPQPDALLGLVGYPSQPSDATPEDIAEYFEGRFQVKRFSFGEMMRMDPDGAQFRHDATTLPGSSGSMMFDIDSGAVVGLHFAGRDYDANFAVPGDRVAQVLRVLDAPRVAMPPMPPPAGTSAAGAETAVASAAALAEMLALREAEDLAVPLPAAESTAAPANWRDVISDRGYQLCVAWETGGKAYYQSVIKGRPVWPGYASGITIGCGYDLGHHGPAQIRADWGGRLGQAAVDRLVPLSGFRTVEPDRDAKVAQARALVVALADIVVPWEMAIAQFDAAKMPALVAQLYAALDNVDRLHPHGRGALLSLVFNRGNGGFTRPGDRYRELRAIRGLMAQGTAAAFAAIPAELRGMKRIWGSASSLSTRREDEARLFEAGLAEEALTEGVRAESVRSTQTGAQTGAGVATGVATGATANETATGAATPLAERHDDLPATTDPDEDAPLPPLPEAAGYGLADVAWSPNDAEQPDYRHLPGRDAGQPFVLKAMHLERLLIWNSFQPLPGRLVFALRGAQLAGADSHEDVTELPLTEARPDHRDFRCVIGVLDRDSGRIWAYRGSTVPNAGAVLQCWRLAQAGQTLVGNILPTGCYTYTVGTHKAGHATREIRGVLRLSKSSAGASEVVVLRSKSDVTYDRYDYWHAWAPADNIHPGRLSTGFSSEGCLTLPGNYQMDGRRHTGLWRDFRVALGLGAVSDPVEDGQQFSVMLVTGREAALAVETLADGAAAMRRLRFGSQGDGVAALQAWLGLAPDTSRRIGPVTAMALIRRQQQTLGWADGIWSAEMADLLGGSF